MSRHLSMPARHDTRVCRLEDDVEGRPIAERGIVNAHGLQDSRPDLRQADALELYSGANVGTPGDEGRLQALPGRQESMRAFFPAQRPDKGTAGVSGVLYAGGCFERQARLRVGPHLVKRLLVKHGLY